MLAIYPIYLIVRYGTPPAILTLILFNLHQVRECVVTSDGIGGFSATTGSYRDLYIYWRVAGNKEKSFQIVLGLIYRFKHYKMENVQKIGHIQWWYLCPGFYGSCFPLCCTVRAGLLMYVIAFWMS